MLADAEEALTILADAATEPSITTAQVRGVLRFLGDSDITPMGRRIFESICEEAESNHE